MDFQDVLNRFVRSDVYKKQIAKEASDAVATRAKLAAELDAVNQTEARELTRLAPLVVKTDADREKASAALTSATKAWQQVVQEQRVTKGRALVARQRLEAQLRELADPRIDAAKRRLEERRAKAWNEGQTVQHHHPEGVGTSIIHQTKSNSHAFEKIMRAIRQARVDLDGLKLVQIDDLPKAIARIEASVPWQQLQELELDGGEPPAAA
jgi:hypothetical protein